MRDDSERLHDILEALHNIERRVGSDRESFFRDELLQVWVVYHLQIIGEAAGRISPALRERFPQVPWADVVDQRNVLVHHYFGIDLEEVWDTVARDLPALKASLQSILEQIELP